MYSNGGSRISVAVFRLNWRRASRVGRSSLVIGVVKDGSVMVEDIFMLWSFFVVEM